ncbi:hypothetical protein EPO14_01270 [Patescibacteria group bacterium]|nr:MAG: hypothetical protein EPO14_01270 [Patescibacteria group bacterium]
MPHESDKVILERLQREPQGGRPFGGMTDAERALRNQQRLKEALADDGDLDGDSDAELDW